MQRTGHWRTVLISSGESRATSFTEDGGTRARVLTISRMPWIKADGETGKLVNQIDAGVKANYGWFGEHFVTLLALLKVEWDTWKQEYAELRVAYQKRTGNNSVAHRIADYFAAIQMAAKLAHALVLPSLPWSYEEASQALDTLWEDLVAEAAEADRAKAALEHVHSYAQSHESEFFGRCEGRPSYKGLAGRWDKDENWAFIAFYPHTLKEIVQKEDFEWDAVRQSWRERGWLETDKDRFTKKMRVGRENSNLIVIRRRAFDDLEDNSPEVDSPSPANIIQRDRPSLNPDDFISE
jgi:putative DNA primase/helicase